jgi:hypothetical protein
MRKPKTKKTELGVNLIEAPQKFWNQLFPNQHTFQKSVATWMEKWMSGTKQKDLTLCAALPAKSKVADIEIIADKSKTTLLIAGKTVSVAPIYSDLISPPYNPQWSIENPLEKIKNSFAKAPEYNQKEVMALFAYASDLAGRQICSALDTALKSGLLILSGTKIVDPFAENIDVARDRISEFRLDMRNNRAYSNVTHAPVLSNIKIRLGSPTKDRSGGQSFEKDDAPLLEEMWKLIDDEKAKGVGAAASLVAHKAKGLGNLESKITRLCQRFRRKYPTRSKN